LACLLAGSLILPIMLINSAITDELRSSFLHRYEDLYAASGSELVFLIAFVLLCLYFLVTIYARYWGSKSIYTYLTLPVGRLSLYWSKLAVFAISLLLLIGVQFLVYRLGYSIMAGRLSGIRLLISGLTSDDINFLMNNGLYLAHVRSEFSRILLPLGFSRLLSSLSLFTAISTGLYYGALCERSRKFYGFIPVGVTAYLVVRVLLYRMNEASHALNPTSLYPSSLLLLAFAVFFIVHGSQIIRRGAIA